jgi:hypothetical protein
MTEEAQDQSFEHYFAAKKVAAAHGFSENFEEEQSFAAARPNAALSGTNFTVINPSDVYVQVVPIESPRFSGIVPGTGKTHIIVNVYTKASGTFGNTFEIVPATIVTSGALETLFPIGQGGSMATQQPPITDEQSVEEIIRYVQTTLPVRYRARLASRLSELEKAVQEEELNGIAVRSLQHFIELLGAYPALRCPAVSVTPDRNIYASWKLGSTRVFSIHFLPDGKVRFVIFCPNDKHPGETIRLSGTATVDVVMSIAEPHGVLNWASDERPGNPTF